MVKKISIIGSGAVGSTLAFHLISRLNLKELVLVDISGDLAKGVALDLQDTRGLLNFTTEICGTKNFSHIRDSDIVVITAGIARREGMSRSDLLKTNAKVAKEVCEKIKKNAPFSIVIVVTNPLDVITYIVTKETDFPRCRVLGMGAILDTYRLLNIIYNETGISVSSLEGYVFGLHTKEMVVLPERIKIKGENLDKFLSSDKIEMLGSYVRERGTQIVSFLKNRSAHFAPSLACYKLIEAVVYDRNEIFPVSVMLNGEYGLNDVCTAVPCLVNRKGIEKIVDMELNEDERKKLAAVKDLFNEARVVIKEIS